MKIDNIQYCPDCDEVFSILPEDSFLRKVNFTDCPSCGNKHTVSLNFLLRRSKGEGYNENEIKNTKKGA